MSPITPRAVSILTTFDPLPVRVLQFYTADDFSDNLSRLCRMVAAAPERALVAAPELCLSGFCYQRMEEAAAFTQEALSLLLPLTRGKTVALTMIDRVPGGGFVNRAYLLRDGAVVRMQEKAKLFPLGDELRHFKAGPAERIERFQVGDLVMGILICFELRFSEFWSRLRGADVILVPAMWGKERAEHYAALTRALAISNQCYVIAADSSNDNMGKNSAVIYPDGKVVADNRKVCISATIDAKNIVKIRRYVQMKV